MERPSVSPDELRYYRAHVQEAVRGDGVVCLECGARCFRLGRHLPVHGLALPAYRAKWGYSHKTRLAVPVPPEQRRNRPLGWYAGGASRRRPTVSPADLAYCRANIREAVRADGVVCLECGTVYRFIGGHVVVHGMTGDAYREKWGYNDQNALIIPELHERKRAIALARNFGAMSPPGSHQKAREVHRQRGRRLDRLETRLKRAEVLRVRMMAGWRPGGRYKVSDETYRALAAEGLTAGEMAARTGQSKTNVYERLKALGLAPRPARPRPIPVPPEELLALRRAGLTVREIAGRIGLSRAVVYERLKRLRERRVEVPGPSRPHAADAGRG